MKLLLLDTNVSSYPIYEYLLSLNHEVFVAGSNPNDCLALCCPNYLNLDYSSLENIEHAVRAQAINHVLPGCNDVSYKYASLYNEKYQRCLNIDPPHINSIINEKSLFKRFALENGLKVPRPISKEQLLNSEYKKVIVKPVDAFSGNGISVLESDQFGAIDEAIALAESFSTSKKVLIEEFIDGQLYSHSAFIQNGKISIDFIVEEHCLNNSYTVDTSWVIPNEEFPLLTEIRSEMELLSRELELCDGLVHTQFILIGNDLRILEVTRRCPGDLYSKLIEYSTGFGYSQFYTALVLKYTVNLVNTKQQKKIIRHTISSSIEQHFVSIKLGLVLSVLEFVPLSPTGALIKKSPLGRIGLIFFKVNTTKDFQKIIDLIINKGLFTINLKYL